MCVKQVHKPPMTGNGKHTTYKNGDDWGMVNMISFYPHYISIKGHIEASLPCLKHAIWFIRPIPGIQTCSQGLYVVLGIDDRAQ